MIKQTIYHWLIGGESLLVLDVPLLFESGLDIFCGKSVVVACSKETQLKRLLARDKENGLTEEDAHNRIKSQGDMAEKIARADIVIDNEGDKGALRVQVEKMVAENKPYKIWSWLTRFIPPLGAAVALWIIFIRYRRRAAAIAAYKNSNKNK